MQTVTSTLTAPIIDVYRNRGYTDPLKVLTRDEVAALRPSLEAIMTVPGLAPTPAAADVDGRLASRLSPDGGSIVPYVESRHLDSAPVLELCLTPAIVRAATAIYGPDLVLWRTTFINKQPGGREFRWHQDFGGVYSRGAEYGLEPPVFFTIYVAITDAKRQHGCLEFIPGVRAILPMVPSSSGKNATMLTDPSSVDESRREYMELNAGQCTIFSDRALHCSAPNTSGEERLVFVMRLTFPMVKVRSHFPNHRCVVLAGEDRVRINNAVSARALLESLRSRRVPIASSAGVAASVQ